MTDSFEIPIKLDNGEGNTNCIIHVNRTLFKNDKDDEITVVWLEHNAEVECCYFENLSNEQAIVVMNAIVSYDQKQVQKSL
jgi:hypothetical protein